MRCVGLVRQTGSARGGGKVMSAAKRAKTERQLEEIQLEEIQMQEEARQARERERDAKAFADERHRKAEAFYNVMRLDTYRKDGENGAFQALLNLLLYTPTATRQKISTGFKLDDNFVKGILPNQMPLSFLLKSLKAEEHHVLALAIRSNLFASRPPRTFPLKIFNSKYPLCQVKYVPPGDYWEHINLVYFNADHTMPPFGDETIYSRESQITNWLWHGSKSSKSDIQTLEIAIWSLIGTYIDEKPCLVAAFADKCMLSSLP